MMKTQKDILSNFTWGLERETHRILPDGTISPELHPVTLKKPGFTKDFAESQLELVTRPRPSIDEALAELKHLTRIAQREIGTERLWPFSMPPRLPGDDKIVTAHMDGNDEGRLAERYRRGLISRYGAARQMICGVHVNASFGEELLAYLRTAAPLTGNEAAQRMDSDGYYLRLMRNLLEDMPFFVTAFGASPVLETGSGAVSGKPAFSYRNSPYGYARTEYRPFLELNSIRAHLEGIRRGMRTESGSFRKLGLVRNGKTVQLNSRVFQKDKEFYAPIRFRRTTGPAESSLDAIDREGVEYMELRFFDIDPFTPYGVSPEALYLTHLFLLDALTRPSIPRPNGSLNRILNRADKAALSDPLSPPSAGFIHDARIRLDSLRRFAIVLGPEYETAIESYKGKLGGKALSRSAGLMNEFRASGLSWTRYGASIAERNASFRESARQADAPSAEYQGEIDATA